MICPNLELDFVKTEADPLKTKARVGCHRGALTNFPMLSSKQTPNEITHTLQMWKEKGPRKAFLKKSVSLHFGHVGPYFIDELLINSDASSNFKANSFLNC